MTAFLVVDVECLVVGIGSLCQAILSNVTSRLRTKIQKLNLTWKPFCLAMVLLCTDVFGSQPHNGTITPALERNSNRNMALAYGPWYYWSAKLNWLGSTSVL
jgi:hypothetical protein